MAGDTSSGNAGTTIQSPRAISPELPGVPAGVAREHPQAAQPGRERRVAVEVDQRDRAAHRPRAAPSAGSWPVRSAARHRAVSPVDRAADEHRPRPRRQRRPGRQHVAQRRPRSAGSARHRGAPVAVLDDVDDGAAEVRVEQSRCRHQQRARSTSGSSGGRSTTRPSLHPRMPARRSPWRTGPRPCRRTHRRGRRPPPGAPDARAAVDRLAGGVLARQRGFRRLLGVRFAAQWGDGCSRPRSAGRCCSTPSGRPTRWPSPRGSRCSCCPTRWSGPFAGALLDRVGPPPGAARRRTWRAVLTVVVAVIVFAGWPGPALPGGAGRGRGEPVRAGRAVRALPHVVGSAAPRGGERGRDDGGRGGGRAGWAAAIGARALFGAGDTGSALTTAAAAAGSVAGAVLAAGFAARLLGPDRCRRARAARGRRRARAGRRRPGHRRHPDRRGVVPRAGRAPAGVRRIDAAHAAAVPVPFTGSGVLRGGLAGVGEAVVRRRPGSASRRC